MGGGKGGADFDPSGKSDNEIMRFCQAFMTELCKHIGPDTDVPAGDIGVGAREIGYLFGQYKNKKRIYRCTYRKRTCIRRFTYPSRSYRIWCSIFLRADAKTVGESISGKTFAVSGFGNVAWGVIKKIDQLGGKAVTLGPDGYIYDPEGISGDKIDYLLELRASGNNRAEDYAKKYPSATFVAGKRPWEVKCDVAIPSATQNELDLEDAQNLVANGCICVTEAANMPSTLDAINYFLDNKVLFSPGKASNAGGVATSGLEMTQNSLRLNWSSEEVDARLKEIMIGIHKACRDYGKDEDGYVNYVKGANIAGFVKVAEAMLAQGVV